MEKFEVIIEYKDGNIIKLNNVEQIHKYDMLGSDLCVKLSIPLKEIKFCYVDFSKRGKK